MARLQWGLTCRDVIIAEGSNAATYRDSIERLQVSELPTILPADAFFISTLWRRDDVETPEKIRTRVAAKSPDQGVQGETDPVSVDLDQYHLYRAHIRNPRILINEEGVIKFIIQREIDTGWEPVKELPVGIDEVSAQVENHQDRAL